MGRWRPQDEREVVSKYDGTFREFGRRLRGLGDRENAIQTLKESPGETCIEQSWYVDAIASSVDSSARGEVWEGGPGREATTSGAIKEAILSYASALTIFLFIRVCCLKIANFMCSEESLRTEEEK